MEKIKRQESPIVRLTRWQAEVSLPKKSSKEPPKGQKWIIYGVDAEGNERVYAQVSDEKFKKWSKTDPLWRQAQSAMFDHLLSDPRTRDIVIMINIQAALRKGDKEMAVELWNGLSESAKAELLAKPEDQ